MVVVVVEELQPAAGMGVVADPVVKVGVELLGSLSCWLVSVAVVGFAGAVFSGDS